MNNCKNKERTGDQKYKNSNTKSSALYTKIDKNNCKNKEHTGDQKAKDLNTKSSDSTSKYTSNRELDVNQSHDDSMLISIYANKIDEC